MNGTGGVRQPGVLAAIGAALLFGAGTPLAKLLLGTIDSWLLAGLLYLGSGLGLALYRLVLRAPTVKMASSEVLWFGGAILVGGVVAPVLLMLGLSGMPASEASLLLNSEGVFTALLAWFVFKENFDWRIAFGMMSILAGALALSWQGGENFGTPSPNLWPLLATLGACLAWAIDNNLTRKVSLMDAAWVASIKGIVAGTINLCLAFSMGAQLSTWVNTMSAMLVGFLAYGVSLALFVVALRHLGTARTGAYFSIAPFIGAVFALVLGEPITAQLVIAALLMAFGIWLHLTERHTHEHRHLPMEHTHEHLHDEHHQHPHDEPRLTGVKHSHQHQHPYLEHSHAHFPDAHHQHEH